MLPSPELPAATGDAGPHVAATLPHVPAARERVDACNLCGSTAFEPAYRIPDVLFHPDEWFDVVRCRGCGLGFVDPRPPLEAMGRYYPPAFYGGFAPDAAANARRYAAEAAWLEGVRGVGGAAPRLLDIGCANGDFPRWMRDRHGFAVEGQEIGPNAASAPDLVVHRAPLPDLPPTLGPFDAITAWAVFEHLHDPMAHFAAVGRLLRPGGRFVFLVTDFDSWSSRHLFREDVPRHLHFFTRSTVTRYLASAGLVLRRAEPGHRIYRMEPVGFLSHAVRSALGRPQRPFEALAPLRGSFAAERGLPPGPGTTLRYALRYPWAAVERALAPLYGAWQVRRGTYGTTVYLAEKPDAEAPGAVQGRDGELGS